MTNKNDIDASDMMVASERITTSLLNSHIYFLTGTIDPFSVEDAIKWIIYENTIDEPDKELTLYINSDGGDLNAAFALVDVMSKSRYPIKTIGIGTIASAAFLIFAAGTQGRRVVAENTSIMIHQYTCGFMAKQHDFESYAKEMNLTNDRLQRFLVKVSSLNAKEIKTKLLPPSDVWLTPQELVNFGIADIIS